MIKKSRRQIKSQADSFEVRVKRDINLEPDCFAIKIPESVKGVFGGGKPILAKTECDFAAYINGRMVLFDCKERDKEKFYINEVCLSKKSCHQYFFMKEAWEKSNKTVDVGYLCHFKPLEKIVWIHIEEILYQIKLGRSVVELENLAIQNIQPYAQRIDIKKLMGIV